MMKERIKNNSILTPSLTGNGDLCLMPDAEGTLYDKPQDIAMQKQCGFAHNCVFRAGRRMYQNLHKGINGDLLPFGSFNFACGAELETVSQKLVLPDGYVTSTCKYGDGSVIDSVFFTHFYKNLYVLHKTYHGIQKRVSFRFRLLFYSEQVKSAVRKYFTEAISNGFRLYFSMDGVDTYSGNIVVFLDHPATCEITDDICTLYFDVQNGESFTFYYCIADSLEAENPISVTDEIYQKAQDYNTIFSEHRKYWRMYFDLGYVKTENSELNSVYQTALYHLKCITTRWSIPVGLNDASWHGKFFAFDEYYGFFGLLTSNRLELARRVPSFRLNQCLKKALQRTTLFTEEQARFMWETTEYGDENAPIGAWYDHVFHMAVVALGAFEYYEFSQDRTFLSECYRMIRACAKFYTLNMIYRDSKKGAYFGKCTDLERLGSSKENAFMSACGAICTLRVCARASEILKTDEAFRVECRETAEELLQNLPQNAEKYLPYPNPENGSIGVFAGKFPFDVLKNDDAKMYAAFADFVQNESEFGNMYRMGSKVSSWYSAWKAEAYARCGMADEAYAALQQACESCGIFDEMYEINEEKVCKRPWFMTAAAVYLSAMNETLIQSDGENIFLLPAYKGKNVAFRLAVKGGAECEVKIADGEISFLRITFRDSVATKRFHIYYKGKEIAY